MDQSLHHVEEKEVSDMPLCLSSRGHKNHEHHSLCSWRYLCEVLFPCGVYLLAELVRPVVDSGDE